MKSGQVYLTRSGRFPRGNPQVIATTLSAQIAQFSRDVAQALQMSQNRKSFERSYWAWLLKFEPENSA